MKRRKFLLGVGSAAAAGSALIGSGAFSQVDAQRQVTIQVAEDPNAYLGMNDCIGRDGEPTANSSFAEIDEDGHLAVDMGPSGYGPGDGGQGVNSESISAKLEFAVGSPSLPIQSFIPRYAFGSSAT